MIFFFIIIILAIIIGKHIYEIHNFNHEGIIGQLQSANNEVISEKIKEYSILMIVL